MFSPLPVFHLQFNWSQHSYAAARHHCKTGCSQSYHWWHRDKQNHNSKGSLQLWRKNFTEDACIILWNICGHLWHLLLIFNQVFNILFNRKLAALTALAGNFHHRLLKAESREHNSKYQVTLKPETLHNYLQNWKPRTQMHIHMLLQSSFWVLIGLQ